MADWEVQRLAGDVACADGQVEKLQRRNAELAAAVVVRDTFIAVAAHELRNPMTPIIGQIELLNGVQASRCPPDQAEQRLERIQRTMRHDVKRASIPLDVSRITSGKLQLEPRAFDLAALLREVAGGLADLARRAGSLITVTGPDTLPVTWDRLAAEQIVDNLAANAIRHGGGSAVEVQAGVHDGAVRIRVRDHGGGMPEAEPARMFERAAGPGERRSGFGIGLWVVRQLAAAMGGTVTIEHAPGNGGAQFTVTLPQHAGGTPA